MRAKAAIRVPLTVTNTAGTPRHDTPITSGIPLKPGMLAKGGDLLLSDEGGTAIPLQWEPLAFWPDKSVKWALLDFQTHAGAGDARKLTVGAGAGPAPRQRVTVSKKGDAVAINTGALRLSMDCGKPGLIDEVLVLDADGAWQETGACIDAFVRTAKSMLSASRSHMSIHVERRGPIRATVAVKGEHLNRQGSRCFSFTLRVHAFAGLPYLKLEYMFLNDNPTGVFTKVREVGLEVTLPDEPVAALQIGGFEPGRPKGDVRLFQEDDRRCTLQGLGRKIRGEKAPGWVSVETESHCLRAAVRDFWQQWPKSIERSGDALTLGLLPGLESDQYAGCEPIDKHYYLFKGADYLIKTGVAKRHEVWLGFGDDRPAEELWACADDPLMAVADPAWIAETGAMGEITPAGRSVARDYDRIAQHNAELYQETTVDERQYGVLNWGDWFGERVHNWGNHEYDTAHAFNLLYFRTGDVAYFHAAARSARHQADVDILHALNEDYLNSGELGGYEFPVDVGAMYLHAFGHVGGYLPLKKAAKLFPKCYTAADPRNLGHLWNEGLFEAYYLTGDPWLKEAALELADYLAGLADIETFTWWFGRDPHCGRTAGWPLHALMAAYHATQKQKYLKAAKRIVEFALADQDEHCGGWIYQLYPGHCFCEVGHRHMGMAVFITGVLLAGMIEYHKVTRDERVADSIVRAVDFMIADAWDDIEARFHYTSCPASNLTTPMRVLWPMAYAVRLADKPLHKHVLRKAWDTYIRDNDAATSGRGYGKSFASAHRSASMALPVLAELEDAE